MPSTPSIVSGNNLSISALMQRLQAEQDAANTANDARYNQSLANQNTQHGVVQGLYGQANADIAGVGTAANTRIDQNLQQQQATGQQNLISRGLGNTSIRDTVARGYNSDAELQHEQVDEQQGQLRSGLATQQAGYENTYGNQLSGIYESRTDQAPDTALYANLIQQAAAGTGGSVPTTTTNYVGPDGRSYNSPGAAINSGSTGTFNAPRGTGGSTAGGATMGGGNTNSSPSSPSSPSSNGSGGTGYGAITGAATGGSDEFKGTGFGTDAAGAVTGAAVGGNMGSGSGQQEDATQTGERDPNWDYTPGAQHSDGAWTQHNNWLAAHGG